MNRLSELSELPKKLSYNKVAGIGFILIFPPLFFISAYVLDELGVGYMVDILDAFFSGSNRLRIFNAISPVVFLSGILLSIALNIYRLIDLNLQKADDEISCSVVIKMRFWNLLIAALSLSLLTVMVGYRLKYAIFAFFEKL